MYRSNDGGETLDAHRARAIAIASRASGIDCEESGYRRTPAGWGTSGGRTRSAASSRPTDGGKTWKRHAVRRSADRAAPTSTSIRRTRTSSTPACRPIAVRRGMLDSGGKETALYKSVNGGEHWKKLSNGIPKMLDRIGLSCRAASLIRSTWSARRRTTTASCGDRTMPARPGAS